MGERAQSRGGRTSLRLIEKATLHRAGGERTATDTKTPRLERLDHPAGHLMGAREHRHLSPSDHVRITGRHRGSDGLRLLSLVGKHSHHHRSGIGASRHQSGPLAGTVENVVPRRDDLRGRTMIDREPDHLDAGESVGHVDEQ